MAKKKEETFEMVEETEVPINKRFVTDEPYEYPDRLFLLEHSTSDGDFLERSAGDEGAVEYLRADTIRAGFTAHTWREAIRFAQRTHRVPTVELERARDLIEEGR